MSEQRPPGSCVLCPPPFPGRPWRLAHERYLTCDDCLERARARLVEIVDRYRRLDPQLGSAGGGRGAPGFESRSPASDHVIAMTDPRSSATAKPWPGEDGKTYTEQNHPPLSIYSEFDAIVYLIVDHYRVAYRQRVEPPQTTDVAELARWINSHLNWASREPIITDIDAKLRALVAQLRNVTDPQAVLAKCPNILEDGTTCGRPLKAPLGTDTTIRCGCGRRWPRSEWEALGSQIRAAR